MACRGLLRICLACFVYNNNAFMGAGENIISRLISVRYWAECGTLYSRIMILVFDPQTSASNCCHIISQGLTVNKFEVKFLLPCSIPGDISITLYFAPRRLPLSPVQVPLNIQHPNYTSACTSWLGMRSWAGNSARPSDGRSAPGPTSCPQAAALLADPRIRKQGLTADLDI